LDFIEDIVAYHYRLKMRSAGITSRAWQFRNDAHNLPRSYEYSVPGMEEDYLPQNQPAPETALIAAH
jgi:hypothetical protein